MAKGMAQCTDDQSHNQTHFVLFRCNSIDLFIF